MAVLTASAWGLLFCCRLCCRRRGDFDQHPHWAECSSQRMSDVVADLALVASIGVHTGGMQFAARICCSRGVGFLTVLPVVFCVVVDVLCVRASLTPRF